MWVNCWINSNIHSKRGRLSKSKMNFHFCGLRKKKRSREMLHHILWALKLKLAALKYPFACYKVLEFSENSKWFRKNPRRSENLTIVKGKKRSLLRKLFCLGDFGVEKNHQGVTLSQKTDSGGKFRKCYHAEIIKNRDWFWPQGNNSLYPLFKIFNFWSKVT